MKIYLQQNPLKSGKKIAMVCHYHVIMALSSKGFDEHGFIEPTEAYNTQLVPLMKKLFTSQSVLS